MKPPIFVRTLSKEERRELEARLRSSDAFVLRRCQILLARKFSWRTLAPYSREPRMRATNRAQRHPRVQRARSRRPQSRLLAPQRGPRRLRRGRDRGTTGDPAPESEELRQREYALDACYGRRSELRRRHNRKKGHGRDHPGDFVAAGGPLGGGEEMDREPGSGVREKKGDRDRLIRLAQTHPEWVLG